MSSARVRSKTLSVARSIVRHLRKEIDNSTGFPAVQDASLWTNHVMGMYRANAAASSSDARNARIQATEFLDYLSAIKEQRVRMRYIPSHGAIPARTFMFPSQSLVVQYGQVDIDATQYREAAAKRVGLTIPERVPLEAQDYASKYDLASKLSQLKGVAGLKAQLYGIESVLPKKKPAAAAAQDTPTGGTAQPSGSASSGPSLEDMLK